MKRLCLESLPAPSALLLAGCLAAAEAPRPIPTIDRTAPAHFETATFALG
jgi:hypothetical protein